MTYNSLHIIICILLKPLARSFISQVFTHFTYSTSIRSFFIYINMASRYAVDNSVDTSGRASTELRIMQASNMDRGDYVCVAANAYGHAKATIHLLVQEPPDFPRNLHVAEQSSRSILLAWSSPVNDRNVNRASSPITNYIVQYKEAQGTHFFLRLFIEIQIHKKKEKIHANTKDRNR